MLIHLQKNILLSSKSKSYIKIRYSSEVYNNLLTEQEIEQFIKEHKPKPKPLITKPITYFKSRFTQTNNCPLNGNSNCYNNNFRSSNCYNSSKSYGCYNGSRSYGCYNNQFRSSYKYH